MVFDFFRGGGKGAESSEPKNSHPERNDGDPCGPIVYDGSGKEIGHFGTWQSEVWNGHVRWTCKKNTF